MAVYIWIIVMILTYIFLYRSGVGRDILAVGGNKEAAKRMGLSQTKAYLLAFGYMGMLAGLASAIAASKIKIAQPSNGTGYGHRDIESYTEYAMLLLKLRITDFNTLVVIRVTNT